jgi:hypothetical protein
MFAKDGDIITIPSHVEDGCDWTTGTVESLVIESGYNANGVETYSISDTMAFCNACGMGYSLRSL